MDERTAIRWGGVFGALVMLASCGSTASTQVTAKESAFEASQWQIVERTGFVTEPVDGLVNFSAIESYSVMRLTSLPCRRAGSSAIEWNEKGFILIQPDDPNIGFTTDDSECDPRDDLHLRFLSLGFGDNQIIAEIAEDGTTATLARGDLTLTLEAAP